MFDFYRQTLLRLLSKADVLRLGSSSIFVVVQEFFSTPVKLAKNDSFDGVFKQNRQANHHFFEAYLQCHKIVVIEKL